MYCRTMKPTEMTVYTCKSCQNIVGNSTFHLYESYIDEDDPVLASVMLSDIENLSVVISSKVNVSTSDHDRGCTYRSLGCTCMEEIGVKYLAAPKNLKHLESMYRLFVSAVDSKKMNVKHSPEQLMREIDDLKKKVDDLGTYAVNQNLESQRIKETIANLTNVVRVHINKSGNNCEMQSSSKTFI